MPSSKIVDKKHQPRNNKKNKVKKNKGDSDSDDDTELFDSDEETLSDTDSSYKPKQKKNKQNGKKRRVVEEEEDEEEDEDEWTDDDDDEDEDDDDDDEDEDIDDADMKKLLSKVFPSKYMTNCAKQAAEKKKALSKKKAVVKKTADKKAAKKKAKNESSTKKKRKNKIVYEVEEEDEEDDDEDEEDDDEDEEEDGEDEEEDDEEGNTFSFVFGLDPNEGMEEEYNEKADEEDCNSDDEKAFMKESYKEVPIPSKESSELPNKKEKKSKKNISNKSVSETSGEITDVEHDYLELVKSRTQLTELLTKQPKSRILRAAVNKCDKDIKKMIKKARTKNTKNYHKLIHADKKPTDEIDYFRKKLSNKEQLRVMKDLKEINDHINVDKPYRLALLDSTMPNKFKATALQKLNVLRSMDPGDNEYWKIKNWVDTFMRVPFGVYKSLSVKMEDGLDVCHGFMERAKSTLDECVFGLDDAKIQIMQMMGQWIANPGSLGSAIAIKGPMGTGKCHGIDTPILMYDGSIKLVQNVIVGDVIMGDDSTPRNVMSLGRGEDEMYDIISNKGIKYSVNSEHILCLKPSGMNVVKSIKNDDGGIRAYKTIYFNKQTCRYSYKTFSNKTDADNYLLGLIAKEETDIVEISVKEFLKLPVHIQTNLKGYTTGVEFETRPVLFDPYIIGVWLGDGASSKSMITNQDSAILHYLRKELKKDNLNLNYGGDYDYRIVYDQNNRPYSGNNKTTGLVYENKNIFTQALQYYNLFNNKHIPDDYLCNNRKIRLEMLAGLIDTDGCFNINDRYFEITQKSKRLSDDIVYLARSLGFAATQNECDKFCVYKGERQYGLYYRVNIYGDNIEDIPTKCPRKQAEYRARSKNALVSKITVVPKGRGQYYGFELDNNHRYVLGNFTVTHNTSLVREGISKILGREFAFIALGGAGDSSYLEGHSYTYEGSTWGKIVQILIDSKCMNPVIYFDELDKVSDTPRGEEIIGILTHLTDTSQNSQFHDKYFSEVDFDLSKCLFIFSYNDESKVNPILRDRMYRIQTKGYDTKEKVIIARNFLLPKIREQVNFSEEDIIIPDETIQYIVSNKSLTKEEDGVRNLKRCLEIIYTKLNLFRLVRPDTKLFGKEIELEVKFPFTVTKKEVDIFIKNEEHQNQSMLAMYC